MTWKAVRQFFAEHYERRRDGRGELDAALALTMCDRCLFLPLLHPPAARRRPGVEAGSAASLTWMQAPLFSLHRQQIRAHLLLGIWDTLVMGSIFSGLPMLTWTKRKEFVLNLHTSPAKTSDWVSKVLPEPAASHHAAGQEP